MLGDPDCITVNHYITTLTHSLNHAIAVSMKRNPKSPHSQFIRAIVLVKGVHFYGFHSSYSPFLKIHIVDPTFVNRAVTLLQSGTIMKTRFRVYESHLSFILQFLCDFGLYGCGWIDLGEVWQRGQDATEEDESDIQNSNATFKASSYYRQTRMALELDVAAHQILNRHRLSPRNIHHKLSIPAPYLSSEPVVISVRELWEDERRRRVERGLAPSPEIPRDLSERSRGSGGDWVQEIRWWEELRQKIAQERDIELPPSGDESWERWVMTTFESIEALWESQYRTWRPRREDKIVDQKVNPYEASIDVTGREPIQHAATREVELEVDEDLLDSQDLIDLVNHQEVEWAQTEAEQQDIGRQEPDDEIGDDGQVPDMYDGELTPKPKTGTPSRQVNLSLA
jgi:DNA polymerase zeta